MFKKILTFFVLFIYLLIGLVYNSMMIFAMEKSSISNTNIKTTCESHCGMNHEMKGNSDKKDCEHSCCNPSGEIKLIYISFNTNNKKKLLDENKGLIKIFPFSSLYFIENKNLVKKTSPPILFRKIKYYSYSDLIKIIKSNT